MIEFLKWDSHFFRKRIGRYYVSSKEMAEQLLQSIHKSDYDLIYLIDTDASIELEKKLILNGLTVIDRKIIFTKEVDPNIIKQDIVTEAKEIHPDLVSIAIQSGEFSRFKLDPKLNSRFKDLYKLWISKSIEKKFDDQVFIIKNENSIQSLITVKSEDNLAKIGLFAVDYNSRGQGLGSKLLKQVENWSSLQKVKTLEVATQKENLVACSFYSKYGFKIKEIHNIYHLWK